MKRVVLPYRCCSAPNTCCCPTRIVRAEAVFNQLRRLCGVERMCQRISVVSGAKQWVCPGCGKRSTSCAGIATWQMQDQFGRQESSFSQEWTGRNKKKNSTNVDSNVREILELHMIRKFSERMKNRKRGWSRSGSSQKKPIWMVQRRRWGVLWISGQAQKTQCTAMKNLAILLKTMPSWRRKEVSSGWRWNALTIRRFIRRCDRRGKAVGNQNQTRADRSRRIQWQAAQNDQRAWEEHIAEMNTQGRSWKSGKTSARAQTNARARNAESCQHWKRKSQFYKEK